jgi:hypothetical protein
VVFESCGFGEMPLSSIQFVNIALGSAGENYSQIYALLRSGEISQNTFDEFDKRHFGVENKLINYFIITRYCMIYAFIHKDSDSIR